jgi:predicted RNA binding protein YcfA (HicA-like mRNA interferase family)
MSRLPIVSSKTFEKVLLYIGFQFVRQKGSHAFYKHPDGRYTTLPHHGQDISRPLASQILKEVKISSEEFSRILEKI